MGKGDIEGQEQLFGEPEDDAERPPAAAVIEDQDEPDEPAKEVAVVPAGPVGKVRSRHPVSVTCGWCGAEIEYLGWGRPRRYCNKSHKNRASEVRTIEARIGRPIAGSIMRSEPVREVVREVVEVKTTAPPDRVEVQVRPKTGPEWADMVSRLTGAMMVGGLRGDDRQLILSALFSLVAVLEDLEPGTFDHALPVQVGAPGRAREWEELLRVLADQITAKTIGIHDHQRVANGVGRVINALDVTHPGGIQKLHRR